MTGSWKMAVQRLAARAGYQIRRLEAGVDLTDPFVEQCRLAGEGVRVVVEVGAADGRDTARYAERFPQAHVYGFEPLPASFAKLQVKAFENPRITAINAAASDHEGIATFHVTAWDDASSLLPPRSTGSTFDAYQRAVDRIEVSTTTLDRFASESGIPSIDLLKVDAQGAELRIFNGAKGLLRRKEIGVIYTEVPFIEAYGGAGRFDQIAGFLHGFGYRLHNLYGLVSNQRGELAWGDAIFIKALVPDA